MEIRKKFDAILSSKSRLANAPRLKGATWVAAILARASSRSMRGSVSCR
jgi:hypothetical protein